MQTTYSPNRLFIASCFALVTTAFAFAIRAGILGQLSLEFTLTDTQLGYINSTAILGFPIATIVGGYLYNVFGAKRMMVLALVSHVLGIVMTIFANGFALLLLSNFFIGFGNGTVEAACNPLIANMYKNNQTTMLNRFHVWFPGGIFLGALISQGMDAMSLGWQAKIAIMLIPTAIYAVLFWGQKFPEAEAAGQAKLSDNLKGMLSPLYLFMLFCMILTANTELSTQQWVERLLGAAGASGMLVLAMVTGLMAVGRLFAGPVIHRLNPTGVLWGSSIIALIGILLMSQATGPMVYVAAILFAVGVCYFWPTMIGFTGEYIPKSGALGMSLMGGMGMFATGIAQPIVGSWLDNSRIDKAQAMGYQVSEPSELTTFMAGLTQEAAQQIDLAAGQATLIKLAFFPMILIVAFGALYFFMRRTGHAKPV
ncbi:MAG: MFS transporter [Bacteroidia bacterium]|nr:MFS transporter [Bacteroidia bacterium]